MSKYKMDVHVKFEDANIETEDQEVEIKDEDQATNAQVCFFLEPCV